MNLKKKTTRNIFKALGVLFSSAQHKILADDPFAVMESALKTTHSGLNKWAYIILGISFIYSVVAAVFFQRWKQAISVVFAGMLIGLWPKILEWIKSMN